MTNVYFEFPPPPENWNLAISWHFEYFKFWHPTQPPPDFKLIPTRVYYSANWFSAGWKVHKYQMMCWVETTIQQ